MGCVCESVGGKVVVAKLKFFSFVKNRRTSGGGQTTRTRGRPETVGRPVRGRFRARDELGYSRWRLQNWSNSSDFVDGNGGDDGGKLDPLMARKIHGSNPTKLHHTYKSQKKLGLILVGIFKIGEEHNKIKLENKG